MSASKRNFTDFKNFPGSINVGKGIYEFPLLKHKDDKNRLRNWQIFVRLVKNDKPQSKIDWNLLDETQIKIKSEYFNIEDEYTELPPNVEAEAWVETGIETGKITRNIPTYFNKVAFKGNKNQRNCFQQALIYARSLYLKRKERGGTTNKSGVKENEKVNIMYFPMLARDWKDGSKYLVYPLYIQPKLDGVRCLAFLQKYNGGYENVIIYSRTQKEFPSVNYLKKLLYPYLNDLYDEKNNQSIYLDGELYVHGKKLQDISGDSRNEKKEIENEKLNEQKLNEQKLNEEKLNEKKLNEEKLNNKKLNDKSNTKMNEYHIYDCFYPLELDTAYKSRKEQLDNLFEAINDEKDENLKSSIKPVPTFTVNDENEVMQKYKLFLKQGYEGAILRNEDGGYLADATKTGTFLRSKNLTKLKKKFTDEFEIVNFTQGQKGKDLNALIWIAKTKNGNEFHVTPKDINYEERYKLYNDCKKNFNSKYNGRMITVEYEDLSKNGIPLRAKALIFRNYE